MSKETLSTVFQPFAQGETSMNRRFGGTGLGLCICKQLVDLMGGQIQVTSEGIGKGTTATVCLDFLKAGGKSCRAPVMAKGGGSSDSDGSNGRSHAISNLSEDTPTQSPSGTFKKQKPNEIPPVLETITDSVMSSGNGSEEGASVSSEVPSRLPPITIAAGNDSPSGTPPPPHVLRQPREEKCILIAEGAHPTLMTSVHRSAYRLAKRSITRL